jgi:hypothetical protein
MLPMSEWSVSICAGAGLFSVENKCKKLLFSINMNIISTATGDSRMASRNKELRQ